jgi:hypothetical protein
MKATIKPSAITLTTRPTGEACLNMTTLTGTFDVEIPAEVWKKLAADAKWFSEQPTVLEMIDKAKKVLNADPKLFVDILNKRSRRKR